MTYSSGAEPGRYRKPFVLTGVRTLQTPQGPERWAQCKEKPPLPSSEAGVVSQAKIYLTSIAFLVASKLPALNRKKYIPEGSASPAPDLPFQVTECGP